MLLMRDGADGPRPRHGDAHGQPNRQSTIEIGEATRQEGNMATRHRNSTYEKNAATSEFKNETTRPLFPIRQGGFSTAREKKYEKRNHLKIARKPLGR